MNLEGRANLRVEIPHLPWPSKAIDYSRMKSTHLSLVPQLLAAKMASESVLHGRKQLFPVKELHANISTRGFGVLRSLRELTSSVEVRIARFFNLLQLAMFPQFRTSLERSLNAVAFAFAGSSDISSSANITVLVIGSKSRSRIYTV